MITDDKVVERLQQNPLAYDKDGEMHYDIISAFIKSIRGSDPDGALYWLARMVEGGKILLLLRAVLSFLLPKISVLLIRMHCCLQTQLSMP
ncbi:hypothetical protein [Phocaeicola coprocola]|uniref:hypothetical protein n=1 Tax=Phocaeicola coprocola TaxID=310298 RepID=UPI00241E9AF9|nr:hypothetical protein [Phocaeicola coprocola]